MIKNLNWKKFFQNKTANHYQTCKLEEKNKNNLYVFCRNSYISKYYIGKQVYIHTGNSFQSLIITKSHVGYKFGEFALTRRHTKKKNEQKK